MANRKSPVVQALRDMEELGIETGLIKGCIRELHEMNIEINIITRSRVKNHRKAKTAKPAKVYAPKPQPKFVYNRRLVFNIDGTVSVEFTEWDYK